MAEAEDWWTGLVSQVVAVSDLDHTPGAGFMAFGSFVFDPANTAAALDHGGAAAPCSAAATVAPG